MPLGKAKPMIPSNKPLFNPKISTPTENSPDMAAMRAVWRSLGAEESAPKNARTRYIRQLQAAILRHVLYRGEVHAVDIVAALPVPEGVHPNAIGTVFSNLEASGLIEAVGFERSSRASRHRGVSRVWRICDSRGAREFLIILEGSNGEIS
jgi:hypothetical protein